MRRLFLMLMAMAFFLVAPASAQNGDAGAATDGGSTAEDAAGLPGDNEGDDTVQDPEVVGQDEGEGEPTDDAPGLPGDNESDDAVQDAEVVGQDEGEGDAAAAGEAGEAAEQVAGGGMAGGQPWTFAAFDENGDGFLSEAEFRGGFFEFISDEPAGIAQDRYEGAIDTFTLGGVPDFETADSNDDQVLDEDLEFAAAFTPDLFQRWDANGDSRLSSQEYAGGMMATFDTNADGTFDSQEFQAQAAWFELEGEVAGGGGAEGGYDESFFLGEGVGAEPGMDGAAGGNADGADAGNGAGTSDAGDGAATTGDDATNGAESDAGGEGGGSDQQ